MKLRLFLFLFLFAFGNYLKANIPCNFSPSQIKLIDSTTSVVVVNDTLLQQRQLNKNQKKEKIITAISAFPFPLGFVGGHRVMLGTKPWVPIVYVATFGGCFGVLPLIDFIVIVRSKNLKQFENNPNVFMWTK